MSTSIDTSFGALFDGALLAFVVYGITCSQVLKYYINYPQDSRSTKLLVAVIWMLDTLHRCITIHCLWFYLVSKGNGNLLLLQRANWSLIARTVPSEIAITLVECFFVMRIWIFSGKKNVSWILLIPIFISFAFGIGYIIKAFRFPLFSDALKEQWLVISYSATRAFADVLVSLVLCIMLYSAGKQSYQSSKGGIIRTLLAYTLTTGVLASTFAVVVLIVYLVMPLNMIYIGVYEVYGTLFFSAMLTSLNSRKSLRAAARRDIILSPHNTDSNNPPSGVIVYTETQKHVSTV